jgi:exodeoxyribonuclease-3
VAARAAFEEVLGWGCADLLRSLHPEGGVYSWWDYRMLAFRRNHGLRIDLILGSRALAEACTSCRIDKEPRRRERPSDHTPVVAELDF